jgi:hypothetical protein
MSVGIWIFSYAAETEVKADRKPDSQACADPDTLMSQASMHEPLWFASLHLQYVWHLISCPCHLQGVSSLQATIITFR